LPKLKPEELASRKQEIVEAARICFLRHGFHKTTTDDICREASITPGGLYHYFGGKQEIVSAVVEQSAQMVINRMHEALESSDTRSAFQRATAFFVETMQDPDRDNIARLDIEIWAETLKDEKLAEINKEGWVLRRQWLEELIKRGIEEGMYHGDNVDPKGLSSLFIAILIGLRVGKVLWQDDFDLNGAILALFLMNSGQITSEIQVPELPGTSRPAATGNSSKAKLTTKAAALR